MRHGDDDGVITELIRADGTVPTKEDSPESTLVERVRFVPADFARQPQHLQQPYVAPPRAPQPDYRSTFPEAQQLRASRSVPALPEWVVPYLVACLVLVLVGVVVLCLQARILGHF